MKREIKRHLHFVLHQFEAVLFLPSELQNQIPSYIRHARLPYSVTVSKRERETGDELLFEDKED